MNKRFIIKFVLDEGQIGSYSQDGIDFMFAELDGEAWDEYGNDHSSLILMGDEISILDLDKKDLENLFPED